MSPMFHSAKINDDRLSIFDFVEYHPEASFFMKYTGDDLIEFSIFKGDILIIDRSVEFKEGKLCVCFSDDFYITKNPKNSIWGVIKYVIKEV
jgi:SOS-response transcriptional repressor LexA